MGFPDLTPLDVQALAVGALMYAYILYQRLVGHPESTALPALWRILLVPFVLGAAVLVSGQALPVPILMAFFIYRWRERPDAAAK